MTRAELRYIVARHEKWLRHPDSGERADLRGSDLRYSDLRGSDLRYSDLRDSDLSCSDLRYSDIRDSNLRGSDLRYSDLSGSDLRDSNLSCSDLRYSNLSCSDLMGSNLRGSNLMGSNLRDSNLSGSKLDFSAWPLWCGSLHVKADDNLVVQMLYHTLDLAQNSDISDELRAALDTDVLIEQANRFYRVHERGQLNRWEREEGAENGLHSGRT